MKSSWVGTAVLSVLALGLMWVPARGEKTVPVAPNAKRIGLVFDVGGRGDKSFNDGAYAGLLQSAKELGITYEMAEPSGAEDREGAMRLFAARHFDLVIGVGYIFTHDIYQVAHDFPDVKFAVIDVLPGHDPVPNVMGIRFREEEGSFLVGAAAGLESKTKQVGFVGGMRVGLIRRFEAGYRAGVKHVCSECKVHVGYAGTTPDAFRDPAMGKAIATNQIANGADILFHAAGATGHGVFEAARSRSVRAIGVDRDQADDMPGIVITSMLKRVDQAVVEAIRSVVSGHFQIGIKALGLKEHGIDWVHEGPHASTLSASTIQKVEQLRVKIVNGTIKVPSESSL
jgi:basic membrane protein A and related proteins